MYRCSLAFLREERVSIPFTFFTAFTPFKGSIGSEKAINLGVTRYAFLFSYMCILHVLTDVEDEKA
jgi:hypothetical protein